MTSTFTLRAKGFTGYQIRTNFQKYEPTAGFVAMAPTSVANFSDSFLNHICI